MWRLYQVERPRSRRQPSRGRPDRVSGGTRGAHPVRTRVNFDSRLRDEQSEHAGGEFLLSQDPAPTAEAWDHRRFRFATVAGDTGVERDETCARVSFLPVASTSPWRSSPPVRRPMQHLKFLAVAKVEAVRLVHLAEFVHPPEAPQLADGKIKLQPPTTAWPPGAICRTMNLSPLQAPMDLSPCARPSSRSCALVEAMCLSTGMASLSTGAASAKGATVPVSALCSEPRSTPRGGRPRRGRRSRR